MTNHFIFFTGSIQEQIWSSLANLLEFPAVVFPTTNWESLFLNVNHVKFTTNILLIVSNPSLPIGKILCNLSWPYSVGWYNYSRYAILMPLLATFCLKKTITQNSLCDWPMMQKFDILLVNRLLNHDIILSNTLL